MVENKKKVSSKKIKIWAGIIFCVIFIGLIFFLFSGDNAVVLKEIFKKDVTKEEVHQSLSSLGWKGYLTIGILSMFQVILAFLPAEPVQVMGGVSFGFLKGSLVCFAGVVVGNTIIYILYKIYGQKLRDFFEDNGDFDFESAKKSSIIPLIVFVLYFLPAIPYGLICFFTASLGLKYYKYILLTALGSIPSILIGVGLGHMAIASSWIISIIVFAVLIILLVILFVNKSKIFAKINKYIKDREKKLLLPKKPSLPFLSFLAFGTKFIFDTKVKVKFINNVGKLEKPSIVISNHGSFIDFVYFGRIIRKERPNFVAARLYFYHKFLGKLLKYTGCIPKSMFTIDVESAKNCVRVLQNNRILALLPEARLSTVGKFEDIQNTTLKFLYTSKVNIYILNLRGSYLANPKWGDGVRKGGYVEAELSSLFTKEEIESITYEDFESKLINSIKYDELDWLSRNPQITYKHKTIAKGLENILYLCPNCGKYHTFVTDKNTITCENCGYTNQVDSRYNFTNQERFKNFAEWYEWQNNCLKTKILNNPEFKLESKVELRNSSKNGKGFTQHSGEGVCVLNKEGLIYKGTKDGEVIEKFFSLSTIYRLLFGAGEDFEIYEGKEIWYFLPEDRRSCVIWYVVSGILKDIYK